MIKIGGLKIIYTVIALSIISCTPIKREKSASEIAEMEVDSMLKSKRADAIENELKSSPVSESQWVYENDVDKMTGKANKYATLFADNTLSFKFPYEGVNHCKLLVRNQGSGNEVILQIDKGQFMPNYMNNEVVNLRFDKSAAYSVGYQNTNDGSSTAIFLNSANSIVNKLKKSEKLLVKVTFYNEGSNILEFNTKSFKW